MGYRNAYDLATETDMVTALSWHFASNMFPPVPQSLIPAAVKAVHAVCHGNGSDAVTLPESILWHGRQTIPARAMVNELRLDAFVDAHCDIYGRS